MRLAISASVLALLLAGCGGEGGNGAPPVSSGSPTPTASPTPTPSPSASPTPTPTTAAVTRTPVATFDNPWAMVFLPDGRLLVTEKPGRLWLVTQAGGKTLIANTPVVANIGQLGLLDVVLSPDHATTGRIYFSYAEPATGGQRLTVARARLNLTATPSLSDLQIIWQASPVTTGGQPGGRIAFSPEGLLYITSGDRQQGIANLGLTTTLGKIVRLTAEGQALQSNPFCCTAGGPAAQVWTQGHRNPYGLVFASDGRLFESEMGPAGGDEFNLIGLGSANFGWPYVSEGDNYDGTPILRHSTNGAFTAPLVSWTPVIAPGGMIQYTGTRFAGWQGDFILAGLVQQGIVRVRVNGATASEAARIGLSARIREVEQGPDGAIWVLEDGGSGRLVRLDPA